MGNRWLTMKRRMNWERILKRPTQEHRRSLLERQSPIPAVFLYFFSFCILVFFYFSFFVKLNQSQVKRKHRLWLVRGLIFGSFFTIFVALAVGLPIAFLTDSSPTNPGAGYQKPSWTKIPKELKITIQTSKRAFRENVQCKCYFTHGHCESFQRTKSTRILAVQTSINLKSSSNSELFLT